jgi:DNA excision repair protein ERCC-2
MQQGDLKGSFISSKRALEGMFGHQILQNRRGETYRREVRISYEVTDHPSGIVLEIQGRIDGIYKQDELFTIEEIKTTHLDLAELELSENGLHFAQAKLYGFLFLKNFKQEKVIVNLTYYQLKTTETKVFSQSFTKGELETFFNQMVDSYLETIRELFEWQEIRNRSIQPLAFPFPALRQGQEQFMSEVSQAIALGYNLFAQAPTGLGKTISVLYPSIKAMAAGHCSKIFYLTARTTTREAPELVLEKLRGIGLRFKSIVITAKEKTCLQDEKICNPEYCEYLFNYFGKIQGAIRDIFAQDRFGREQIEACARKHKVCPFELSLDLSLISDCIICDYNYFFDPRVQLARYDSDAKQPYVYLVDEAHNLVERSRDMYSASLEKKSFLACKRLVDKTRHSELYDCLTLIDTCLLDLRKNGFAEDRNEDVKNSVPGDLIDYLIDFLGSAEQLLTSRDFLPFRDPLLELYYQVTFFLKINQLKQDSDAFTVLTYRKQSELTVKLMCLDASGMLRKKIEKAQTTVFFSATLTPADYFSSLLGGSPGDRSIQLPSPFPATNRCLCLVDHISTRYRDRYDTYDQIADYLAVYIRQKPGNFLIFFPSYQYLTEVYSRYQHLAPDVTLLRQETGMREEEREAFLAEFTGDREQSLVGFVIMGGIFGESIDLPGNRLTGAAVVGVGLPQVNLERNLIREYHDAKSGNGFHYAYTYPGMNKVLQAAGRLIRTETDRGTLLLIDDRFATPLYKRLFPPEWEPIHIIRDNQALNSILSLFWK